MIWPRTTQGGRMEGIEMEGTINVPDSWAKTKQWGTGGGA